MFMKEVVWVYGPSASGKETFIRKMIDHPPEILLKQFGWTNKKIGVSQASLDHIGQFSNDPIVQNREVITKETTQLLKNLDIILIKGQFEDFETNRPQQLKNLIQSAEHKVLIFQIDLDELSRRLPKKKWWSGTYDAKNFLSYEKHMISNQLKGLKDFEVIHVDSSDNGNYRILAKS